VTLIGNLFHGTTSPDFVEFRVPASGVHFGDFEQAAHAATIKLGKLPLATFAALREDASGWRGRIIGVELNVHNVQRSPDMKTPAAWARAISKAKSNGVDCLVYANEFEGRKPAESYVVFHQSSIRIVDLDVTRPERFRPTDKHAVVCSHRG